MDLSPRRRWALLITVSVGLLLIVVDNTALFTALPEITRELDATATEKLWIINAYPLVMAGLLLGAGTLGDRIGHRRMFVAGLAILTVASLLAAFSPTAATLIAARALLAIGAAAMMPATLALIRMTFTDERELGLAIGVWGAIAVAGAALGPLLGGLLLEWFWWGSVFLVNVPIALAAIVAAWWTAPPHRPAGDAPPWDLRSSLQAMVALGALVAAFKEVVKPDPAVVPAAVLLVVGVLAGWRFVVRQRRLPHPLLDFSIFRRAPVIAGVVSAMVAMFTTVGIELATTQRLQLALDFSPLHAGLLVVAVAVGALPSSLLGGAWLHRVGLRPLLVGGLAVAAFGLAIVLVGVGIGLGLTTFGMLVLGGGVGTVFGVASVGIVGYVPRHRAGMASSVEEVSYEAGSLTAVAVLGSVLTAVYAAAIDLPAGAPSEAADGIDRAHALAVGPSGPALLDAASTAFDQGYVVVVALCLTLLVAATGFVAWRLRGFDETPEDVTPAGSSADAASADDQRDVAAPSPVPLRPADASAAANPSEAP